jgi:glutamate racemase
VRRRVEPLLDAGADRLVLGCTHFPHLAPLLREVCAGRAVLVDPSAAVARQARRLLQDLDPSLGAASVAPVHLFVRT